MANALDVAKAAKAAGVKVKGNLSGWCQYYVGLMISAYLGRTAPGGYTTAGNAYKASTIVSRNPNDAVVGDNLFFDIPGNLEHVAVCIGVLNGRAIMVSATSNRRGEILDLGGGVLVSWVDEYASSRPFLGVSKANGTRPAMPGMTGWVPATPPPPKPGGYTFKMVVGDGCTYQEPTGEWANRLLRGLVAFGLDPKRNSISDGVIGPNTRKAIQRSVVPYGYTGVIDGKLGPNTLKAVQRRAKALGGYAYGIDGVPGINTWNGYAKSLGQ